MLTPPLVGTVAIAWPAIASGVVIIALDQPWTYAPLTAAVVIPCGLAAILAAAWLIARAKARGEAAVLAFLTLPTVAGACTFALCFAWDLPISHDISRAWWIGTIMAVQSAIVGAALAIWQAALGALVTGHLRTPSHDLRDRLLARPGLWIALPAIALGLLVGRRLGLSSWGILAWTLCMVVMPLALTTVGFVRMRQRRRWLAAVARGQVARWRVVDLGDRDIRGMVPLLTPPRDVGTAKLRVLVETEPAEEPFRDIEKTRALALVFDDSPAE